MASERTAIERLDHEGFVEHFAVADGSLHGLDGGKAFRPDQVVIRKFARFEGVSDPDDMAILYAIESSSGTRGTLVDAFGVYSDPGISAYLGRVSFASAARGAGARVA